MTCPLAELSSTKHLVQHPLRLRLGAPRTVRNGVPACPPHPGPHPRLAPKNHRYGDARYPKILCKSTNSQERNGLRLPKLPDPRRERPNEVPANLAHAIHDA